MDTYTLKYNSRPISEEQFLDDLVEILEKHNIDGKIRRDICLTMSEAFNNALEHGNRFDPAKVVFVTIQINEDSLSADIIDEGENGLESITRKSRPDLLSESGRGVDLIHHYASTVRFETIAKGGLKVTLIFDRKKQLVN